MAWTQDQMVADHLPPGVHVALQSENGLLGIGPIPYDGEEEADLTNAEKQTATLIDEGRFRTVTGTDFLVDVDPVLISPAHGAPAPEPPESCGPVPAEPVAAAAR